MVMPESALILCVDDDRSSLELRKALLETNGFAVMATTSASQALKLFRANPVNLVVADHLLSNSTGVELAREMKRLKPTVPIVLYSGTLPESLEHVDCFVLKSEPVADFLAFIRDLAKRSRQ
jgi:CheY-like chemotaxis protein